MSTLSEKRVEGFLALTTKMIQVPSYSGQENLVMDVMKRFCDEHKFTDIHADRYDNCVYHIKSSRPGPKLLFDGHVDMVSVPDKTKWEHDPFGTEIVDGRMCGCGTSDMKGVLPVMLAVVLHYAEDANYGFPDDIYVADVIHEECFEGVTAKEISAYMKPGYVIIGETFQPSMKIGQKGRTETVVEAFGVPAYSVSPHKGVNAVYKMCRIVEEINKPTPSHHGVLGDDILELVDAGSSPCPGTSVVPNCCRAAYDRRLLTGEIEESVLAPLRELLDRMMKEDPQLRAKVSYVVGQEKCWAGETIETERFFPGWFFGKNKDWVQGIYKEMRGIGLNPNITNYDFCTSVSYYAGETGIRCVGAGPSLETLARTINEYIKTDQLNRIMEPYYGVMKTSLK